MGAPTTGRARSRTSNTPATLPTVRRRSSSGSGIRAASEPCSASGHLARPATGSMIGARPRTTSQLINPRVRPSPTGVPPSSRAELVAPIVHDPSDVVAIGVAGLAMWVSRRPVASRELVRETASMTAEYAQTDRFRGARIHLCDLAGLEIRDCEVSGLKIVDCYGSDVYLGGDFERLVVNDVDVTMYVEAELNRQHPVRVLAV